MIPDAAVEAAAKEVLRGTDAGHHAYKIAYAALEAAAPHMRQAFFLEMNLRAVEEELNTPFRKATYGDDMR